MTQSTSPQFTEDRLAVRYDYLGEGHQPYPQDGHRTHTIAEALAAPIDVTVTICGRICAIHDYGTTQIFEIEDESGSIHLLMTKYETESFDKLHNFHTEDFIRAQGTRILTEDNLLAVIVDQYDMLTKTLRSLPSEDSHIGENERYLAWSKNSELRRIFRQRHWINASIRDLLDAEGYLEAATPILHSYRGIAPTRPFTTNLNSSSDTTLYLKKSSASYLKRMIVGGFEKVYEISTTFRNEEITDQNNVEGTLLECYSAYADYKDMLMLIQRLYQNAAIAATGTDIVYYDLARPDEKGKTRSKGIELNFRRQWKCLTVYEAIRDYLGIDVTSLTDVELQETIAQVKGIPVDLTDLKYKPFIRGLKVTELFKVVEPNFIQPTFIIDFPRDTTAFCKRHRTNPELVERLEVYMAGTRVGCAYTELNDPVLQREFMEDAHADKTYPIDEELIAALEYGMPPTSSMRLNLDRMVMLLTNARNIRDVILFPMIPHA
ncbi:MAG: hypothetical protein KF716_04575 [Anaerolineae bacterium]|nr:hypothetical protein [Anaerolineae bacterium]